MFITMTCSCGADLELDLDNNDTLGMTWAQRFADSHTPCGFMSPLVKDRPEETRVLEKPQKKVNE